MSQAPDIPRLEAAFRALAERMAGSPGWNPALSVVAAGFRPWDGGWVGAVVAPWAIQVVFLPNEGQAVARGERRQHVFPSGERTLVGLELEGFGPMETAVLLSSVAGHASQREAELAALAAFAALMSPDGAEVDPLLPRAAPPESEPVVSITKRPVSRRDFLRGRLFGRRS